MTFAREFLPREGGCLTFINADLIAAGLAPFAPATMAIQAAKLMSLAISKTMDSRRDFAVETTLAGRGYLSAIAGWQAIGYQVRLIFLQLPSVELAIERVRLRVRQRGHDIPEEVIRRRFDRGLAHFLHDYRSLVNAWWLYDASNPPPILSASGGQL